MDGERLPTRPVRRLLHNPRLPQTKTGPRVERLAGFQTGRASGTQNSRLDSGCERRLKDSSKALGLVNGRRALLLI